MVEVPKVTLAFLFIRGNDSHSYALFKGSKEDIALSGFMWDEGGDKDEGGSRLCGVLHVRKGF